MFWLTKSFPGLPVARIIIRLFKAMAQVRSQVGSYRIYCGQSGTGKEFLQMLRFPLSFLNTIYSTSITHLVTRRHMASILTASLKWPIKVLIHSSFFLWIRPRLSVKHPNVFLQVFIILYLYDISVDLKELGTDVMNVRQMTYSARLMAQLWGRVSK
jgi:hypothetical protein